MLNQVCIYLELETLEMVETSSPVISAISRRIIGFNLLSSPVRKNGFWNCTIAVIVNISVLFRCCTASINERAEFNLYFTKDTTSFFSREFEFFW